MYRRLLWALIISFVWSSASVASSATGRVVRKEYMTCSALNGPFVCTTHVEDVVDPCPSRADFANWMLRSKTAAADFDRAKKALDDCSKRKRGKAASCATERHGVELALEAWRAHRESFRPMTKLAASNECINGEAARADRRADYLENRKVIEQAHRAKFIVGWEFHSGLFLQAVKPSKIYKTTPGLEGYFFRVEMGNAEVDGKFSQLHRRMISGEFNGKRLVCDCVGTLYEYSGMVDFVPTDATFSVE
jgi:hypothetical protein